MSFVLLSASAFCIDEKAQIAAGIQPITVHCKNKQIKPVPILPLDINDIVGKIIANKYFIFLIFK